MWRFQREVMNIVVERSLKDLKTYLPGLGGLGDPSSLLSGVSLFLGAVPPSSS